jgi:hypothetical protein
MLDELHLRDQSNRRLREEANNLRSELKEQVALLSEFEIRFQQQAESAQKEIEALQTQISQREADVGRISPGKSSTGTGGDAQTALLAEADQTVKVLAAEKVQLLEAYELLEQDTGRLIDEAVEKKEQHIVQLEHDLRVRGLLLEAQQESPS